jgi:hypothetical protein
MLSSFAANEAVAAPSPWGWAVITNQGNGLSNTEPGFVGESIYTVDLSSNSPVVHGPFLSGQLGPLDPVTHEPVYGGGVFDVTQIPETKDVLISNFGYNMIFRVSLVDPTNPVVVGSVEIDFFAEDIAISKDGRLAIVTDGGFSPKAAFIDVQTMTHKSTAHMHEGPPYDEATPPDPLPTEHYANAVVITPDGKTAIMANYFGSSVVYGRINAAQDGFESTHELKLCNTWDPVAKSCGDYLARPVNLSISPDGQTVIVNDAGWGMVSVLRVTGPGQVVAGTPFQLWGFPDTYNDYDLYENYTPPAAQGHGSAAASQSTSFSPDGRRAYILQNATNSYTWDGTQWVADSTVPNKLSWVSIDGPGQASFGGYGVADLYCDSGSQLFGVDTLAIDKSGRYAYAANPTLSGSSSSITRVDLSSFATTEISFDMDSDAATHPIPTGIAILAPGFDWSMFMPAIAHNHSE